MLFRSPIANKNEVKEHLGINIISERTDIKKRYDAIILGVAHETFKKLDLEKISKDCSIIYDIKGFLDRNVVTTRL